MDVSASVAAWIAIGAAALAVVAAASRSRAGCGSGGCAARSACCSPAAATDMVDFAVSLQGRIDDLHRAVDEISGGLASVGGRVDNALANRAVVRYDAYESTGGHQSASVALLDTTRSGVVVTAIQGRDYARIYVKELERGRSSVPLSPEEQEALDRAMG